jgi:hypothetical protein
VNEVQIIKSALELGVSGVLLYGLIRIYGDREALAGRYMSFLEKQNARLLEDAVLPDS